MDEMPSLMSNSARATAAESAYSGSKPPAMDLDEVQLPEDVDVPAEEVTPDIDGPYAGDVGLTEDGGEI